MIDIIASANETADYNYVVERIAHAKELVKEASEASRDIQAFLEERNLSDFPIKSAIVGIRKGLYEVINAYLFLGDIAFFALNFKSGYTEKELLNDLHTALSLKGSSATPLEELNLPSLVCNALRRVRITTAEELATYTETEILSIRHIGHRYIEIISEALASKGLSFQKEDE